MTKHSNLRRWHPLFLGLILSLMIHSLAVFPFLHDLASKKSHLEKAESSELEVMLLEPTENPRSTSQPTSNASASKKSSATSLSTISRPLSSDILRGGFSRKHVAMINSQSMFEENGIAVGSRDEGDPMAKIGPSGHGWSGAVQFGNAMGLKQTLETLSYFQALHTRINGLLVYPDDFSRQRITGRVRIEAELGKDGRLIRFLSTTADDRLLQTYCFAVLLQILKNPLPKGAWLENESALVAFDFDFHTRIPHEAPRIFPPGIEKNRLAFGRENEVDPLLNEKIDEILTHYIPPIVPLPGGFYVDLIRAYQFVNNLIEGTPTESEQRQARIEKLHEVLRTTVREQKPSPTPALFPDS